MAEEDAAKMRMEINTVRPMVSILLAVSGSRAHKNRGYYNW